MTPAFVKNFLCSAATTVLLVTIAFFDIKNPYAIQEVEKLKKHTHGLSVASVLAFAPEEWEKVPNHSIHIKDGLQQFWFKKRIFNQTDQTEDFVFEFDVPFTPGLEVYLVRGRDEVSPQPLFTDIASTKPNRIVRLEPGQSCEILYTLASDWLYDLVPVSLYQKDDFLIFQRVRLFLIITYLGGIFCILAYNLSIYLAVKEISFLYYVGYHAAAVLFIFPHDGLIRFSTYRDNYNLAAEILAFSFLGMHLFATLFINSFLNNKENSPSADRIARWIFSLLVSVGVCSLLLPGAVRFVVILTACVAVELIFLCVNFVAMRLADRAVFFVAWTLVGCGSFITVLSYIGVFPAGFVSRNLDNICVSLEAVLLSYALAQKLKQTDREKSILQEALASQVSRLKLNEIFGKVYNSRIGNIKREAATLFACVSDFNDFSTKYGANVASTSLKIIAEAAYDLTPKYFGLVDRFVGDGILAVFGLGGGSENHCEAAFSFAIALQLAVSKEAQHKGLPQIPLRIGIHVDFMMIGNLGKSQRADFSIVGHGVNLTKRLEANCAPLAIRMTREVFSRLPSSSYDPCAMYSTLFMAKNIDGALLAYEYLPLRSVQSSPNSNPHDVADADANANADVNLISEFGNYQIKDCADEQLIMVGAVCLSRGMTFAARLEFRNLTSASVLNRYWLLQIKLVISLSEMIAPDHFILKARIVGGNDRQKQLIFDTLNKCFVHSRGVKIAS